MLRGVGIVVASRATWELKNNLCNTSGSDGAMQWMTQFGSTADDHLSRGVGITADRSGNLILYGDTTGALYRYICTVKFAFNCLHVALWQITSARLANPGTEIVCYYQRGIRG